MTPIIIRTIYLIIVFAVVFVNITPGGLGQSHVVVGIASVIGVAVLIMLLEMIISKKAIASLVSVFFGLLVGIFISWAVAPVVDVINDVFYMEMSAPILRTTKWIMGICICYLVISFVMRTKDDVRFVIPYVEFSRQAKGARPLILDTSVIIDGRIADLCQTRLFDAPLVVPRFVLNELQLIADSADKLKRNRGRRGLDMLNKLRANPLIEVKMDDTPVVKSGEVTGVDEKLVTYAKNCDGRLVTNDYNLNKVAQLHEVDVININDLANALKPIVLPGEIMKLKIIKPGEEIQQGIGYLDDGTMVVVEDGRDKIGSTVSITVTSALQTSAGRMIFGRYDKTITEPKDNSSANARTAAKYNDRRSTNAGANNSR